MTQRALLGVDGDCGFALLGEDLAVGEAEFVPVRWVDSETRHRAEQRAAHEAFTKLKARLGLPALAYALGPGLAV